MAKKTAYSKCIKINLAKGNSFGESATACKGKRKTKKRSSGGPKSAWGACMSKNLKGKGGNQTNKMKNAQRECKGLSRKKK